jgi:TonB family protein
MRWLLLGVAACGGSAPRTGGGADAPAEEPPVALNAEPTVQYPPTLYDQGIEGDVELRLFVDSTGRLATESTRVTESSGNAALDSAAVRGVARVRYAPARRHGLPAATSFLQTIEFGHPGVSGAAATPRARTDSTRPRRDSTGAVPQARPDSAPTPPPAPAPDSTNPKPDSSGAAS